MEWISLQTLATVAGASAAVTLVTRGLKNLLGLNGKLVILLAFVLALAIVAAVSPWAGWPTALLWLLNAAALTFVAVGINETVK